MKKFTSFSKLTALAVAGVVLAGCANQPDAVVADFVDPSIYEGKSCEELRQDFNLLDVEYRQAYRVQKEAADSDFNWFLGSALLFPPTALAVLDDDDASEARLASLKGRRDALVSAAGQAECQGILTAAALSR